MFQTIEIRNIVKTFCICMKFLAVNGKMSEKTMKIIAVFFSQTDFFLQTPRGSASAVRTVETETTGTITVVPEIFHLFEKLLTVSLFPELMIIHCTGFRQLRILRIKYSWTIFFFLMMDQSIYSKVAGLIPSLSVRRYLQDQMKEKTVIQHMQKKLFQSIGIILKRFYKKIRAEIDDIAICAGRGCF